MLSCEDRRTTIDQFHGQEVRPNIYKNKILEIEKERPWTAYGFVFHVIRRIRYGYVFFSKV
jgi:hypothetical protein